MILIYDLPFRHEKNKKNTKHLTKLPETLYIHPSEMAVWHT